MRDTSAENITRQDAGPTDGLDGKRAAALQSPERRALGRKILAMLDEARAKDRSLNTARTEWYRWYRGYQWSPYRPSWLSAPVINIILPSVEAIVGMLTANYPRFQVRPEKLEDAQAGQVWNERLEFWWFETDMSRICQDWAKNGVMYGAGILGLTVEQATSLGGNGNRKSGLALLPAVVEPWDFHLDPFATSVQNSRYAIYLAWADVDEVERKYGVRLKASGETIIDPRGLPEGQEEDRTIVYAGIAPGEGSWTSKSAAGRQKTAKEKARIVECWWEDGSSTPIPLERRQQEARDEDERMTDATLPVLDGQDHETHEEIHRLALNALVQAVAQDQTRAEELAPVYERIRSHADVHAQKRAGGTPYDLTVRAYPKGRLTVVTEDGYVLWDGANPFGFKPFVCFPFSSISNEPFGIGVPELVKPIQRAINQLSARVQDCANLAASPPLCYSTASGLDPALMVVRPNAKWPITDMGQLPQFVRTSVIPFDKVQNFIDHLMFVADILTGTHDVMQGRMPVGARTSGRAIGRLQEFGMKRIGQAVRLFSGSLRELGAMVVRMMQDFFEEAETFPTRTMTLGAQAYERGQFVRGFRGADYAQMRFFVTVETNALLPQDKLQTRDDAIMLHNKRVIDEEALLDALDFPDRARVLERMRTRLEKAGLGTRITGEQPGEPQEVPPEIA